MSEKKEQVSGNVIDITEHLKGSLGPQPSTVSVVDGPYDSKILQSAIRHDLLLSIKSLTFEAKIVQAKAFLEEGRLIDAKILFESALEDSETIPAIYLRIIDLLKFTGPNNNHFLNEFQKLTADLIKDLEITYLKNFSSIEFANFIKYYQLVTQFAFNFNLIDRTENEDLLFEIMQKHRKLTSLQDYNDVKELSGELMNDLKKLGGIS